MTTGGVADCANSATTPKTATRRNVPLSCGERYRITVRPVVTVRLPRLPCDDEGKTGAVSLSEQDRELAEIRRELQRLNYGAWKVIRSPVDGSFQATRAGKVVNGETVDQVVARCIVSDGRDVLGNPFKP